MDGSDKSEMENKQVIDIWAFFSILFRHRYGIFIFAILAAGITGTINKFFIQPYYIANAVIMPELDRPQGTRGAIESFIGGSSGTLGQFIASSSSNVELSQYERLIKSEKMAIGVLNRLGQDKWIKPSPGEKAEMTLAKGIDSLQKKLKTKGDRVSLSLELQHTDPELAAAVVRTYLEELQYFLQSSNVTRAKAAQLFTEQRLAEATAALKAAEIAFSELQMKAGIVQLPAQTSIALNTAAQLRARIIEKDLEIDLYKNIIKNEDQIDRIRDEKHRLESQLDKLLGNTNRVTAKNSRKDLLTPLDKIPDLEIAFAEAKREFLIQENLVELLRQQVELSRIDSKRNEPMFQVIDEPRVPVFRAGPSTLQNTLVAFATAFFAAIIFVLLMEHLKNEARLPKPLVRLLKNDRKARFRKTA